MDPIKVQIFRLSTARMKINQIPYVIFQATNQFWFKLCNTLQCHDTQFLLNFLTETVHDLEKKSPSIHNIQTFVCSDESSPNSSCHFWNHKIIKDNSPTLFSSNLIYFGQKYPNWSEYLGLLSSWMKSHQIPQVIFETTSRFSFKFLSFFNVMGHKSFVLFR